jgi:hypothetical protein
MKKDPMNSCRQANGHISVLPQHLDDLRRSGLTDETIVACRFFSVADPSTIARCLGWKPPADSLGPCLAIPFPDLKGDFNGYVRLKPDRPRKIKTDGKFAKYESPRGKGNRAYFPISALPAILSPTAPLLIVEGEKKAAAATQAGFPTVGLTGVWNWQRKRTNKDGPRELINDLAAVPWKGRPVVIVFDSDLVEKPEIALAELNLGRVLEAAGAIVKVGRLSGGASGEKVGVDDFLIVHGTEALRDLIEQAQPTALVEDVRSEIMLSTSEHTNIDEAIKALAKHDDTIFQRGGVLVRLLSPTCAPAKRRIQASGAPRIEPIPIAYLRTRLTRCAKIVKSKTGTTPTTEAAHPPPWLVRGVEAAGAYPGIRPLEAVLTTPVLLANGTVLQKRGYDEDTGILLIPDSVFRSLPENPSHEDAKRALEVLLDVVCDFPFELPEHKSAWLAGLLTAVGRYAFHGPAPLFLADANVRGAGKGLLLDCISMIATGRGFARATYTKDDAEFGKTVTAIALEGERLVLLDNVSGTLGSATLDAALTTTDWQGRILGASKQPRLPLTAVWYATANNAAIGADTGRRICPIRLDSHDELPEERIGFKYPNLLEHVLADRENLLAAALTILRAYCAAGRPQQDIIRWGSFESWSDLVCGSIAWLGMRDPGKARQEIQTTADREANALRSLIAGWEEIDPSGNGMAAKKAIELLKDDSHTNEFTALREALLDLFDIPPGGLPTPLQLGATLRRFRHRNVGGKCFVSTKGHGGTQVWKVRKISSTTPVAAEPDHRGDDGDDGDDASPGFSAMFRTKRN